MTTIQITPPLIIKRVSVTVPANNTTGSTAHNMGKTPNIIGRPNPNQLDGLDSIGTADGTNVNVTTNASVTTDTVFTFDLT